MIPIFIDTESLFEGLPVSSEQVDIFVDSVVKDITYAYYIQLNKEAQLGLGSTKSRYINNIRLIDSGRLSGTVLLDYSKDGIVRMIEEGSEPFDMKTYFLQSKKIKT